MFKISIIAILTAILIFVGIQRSYAGCLIRGTFVNHNANSSYSPANGRLVSSSCGGISFSIPKGGISSLGGSNSLYDTILKKELLTPGSKDTSVEVSPGMGKVVFIEMEGSYPNFINRLKLYDLTNGKLTILRESKYDSKLHDRLLAQHSRAINDGLNASGDHKSRGDCHGKDITWIDDNTIGLCLTSFDTDSRDNFEVIKLSGN
jgi:hypothetical protein